MKRGIILSDTHCGAYAGLTPPGFMQDDWRAIQTTFWDWYTRNIEKYAPFDFLIACGDLTDGEGKKGTLETAFSDVRKQAKAAAACLSATFVEPYRMFLVRGTPFHSAGASEYEDAVADQLPGSSIADVQRLEVEGWKIHARHTAGRSDIPYGQGTPLYKEIARMEHEAFRDDKDAPDILIRGHVHYSAIVGKHGRMAISCPALELPFGGSNARRYSSWEYDVGFGVLELEEGKEPLYRPVLMEMKTIKEDKYRCVKW